MSDDVSVNNIIYRLKSPTPKFWRKIRNTMITLGAIGGVIIAAPVALPAALITAAGYMVTAGGVGAVFAQMTKEDNEKEEEKK